MAGYVICIVEILAFDPSNPALILHPGACLPAPLRTAAAMAGVLPRRRRVAAENSALYWVDGNPNRKVAGAKGKGEDSKIRCPPGVPREEYTKIEISKDDLVADERINRANKRLVNYYNQIRSCRIEILETSLERKAKVKAQSKSTRVRRSPESRPSKTELAHLKAGLKGLMARMDEMLASVRHVGGVPIPPPRHFAKELPV